MKRSNFLILMVGTFLSCSLGAMNQVSVSTDNGTSEKIGTMLRGIITIDSEIKNVLVDDALQQKWKNFGILPGEECKGKELQVVSVKSFTYQGSSESNWIKKAPRFVSDNFVDVNGELQLKKDQLSGYKFKLCHAIEDILLFPSCIPWGSINFSNSQGVYKEKSLSIDLQLPGCKEVSIPIMEENEEIPEIKNVHFCLKDQTDTSVVPKKGDLNKIDNGLRKIKLFLYNHSKQIVFGSAFCVALYILCKSEFGQNLLNKMSVAR